MEPSEVNDVKRVCNALVAAARSSAGVGLTVVAVSAAGLSTASYAVAQVTIAGISSASVGFVGGAYSLIYLRASSDMVVAYSVYASLYAV